MGAAAVIGTTIFGGVMGAKGERDKQRAQQKQQAEALRLERIAARHTYSAKENSVNIMKAVGRENSYNATVEILRTGAEDHRETELAIDVAASKVAADNEGLVSGRSKGRQMMNVYVKGNKILRDTDAKSISIINQITSAQDEQTNQLNNELINAHEQLAATLANRGTNFKNNTAVTNAAINGAMSGLKMGMSF